MAHLLGTQSLHVALPDRVLLDDVTVGIDEGDRIGVVGRNGDGKSTLLRLLARTREPDSGRVTVRGVLNTGFEKVFLMQNTLNLPVSEVIATYTYKIGILSSQFSYSTAIGLFNTVINFAFLVIANQISKRASDTSLW